MSQSDPARKVEQNHAFAKSRIIQDSKQRERRGNPEKAFYIRRTVDLWIATLNTLQTVQSFAMTYLKLSWTVMELVSASL